MKTKQFNLRMDLDVIAWVNEQALKDDRTPGIWLSRFINQHMGKVKPKVKKAPKDVKAISYASWPYTPDTEVLEAWLKSKKAAGGSISQLAIDTVGAELHKAAKEGFNIEVCLRDAENAKWKGFKASWMKGNSNERNQADNRAGVERQLTDPNYALANF